MCGGGDNDVPQTEEEKALGEIAVARWNDYQTRFLPVENEYMHDVQMTDSDYEQVRGQAGTSVQQSFGGAQGLLEDNLFATGVDPSSSQFKKSMAEFSDDRALSLGSGINEAELGVDTQHLKGLQTVVAMGQNQAFDSIGGLSSVASNAASDAANRATNSYQNRQGNLHLVGTIAGAGTAAYMNSGSTTPQQSDGWFNTDISG